MYLSKIALIFAICIPVASESHANNITGVHFGDTLFIDHDTTISTNSIINADNIYIKSSATIINNGTISGNIHICDGCMVNIKNSGNINGQFNIGDGAIVTQIIQSESDINPLNIDYNFQVAVNNATNLNMADIISAGQNADKITLRDSTIFMDTNHPRTYRAISAPTIEIIGDVTLMLDDIDANYPLLSNIDGNGTITINAPVPDAAYTATGQIRSGNLYLRIVRETDYFKLFNTDHGAFLNTIRANNPNDKLIAKLDSATSMNELYSIMNKSARLNPILLMQPARIMNRFLDHDITSDSILKFTDDDIMRIDLAPMYITTHDGDITGIHIRSATRISNNILASIGIHGAHTKFNDISDSYDGTTFGLDAAIRSRIDKTDINLTGGITFAMFDTPGVLDSDTTTFDPSGFAGYTSIDIRHSYNITKHISIAPIIGAYADYATIIGQHDHSVIGRGGAQIEFINNEYDIQYTYRFSAQSDTKGGFDLDLHAGLTSPADAISVELVIGATKDQFDWSAKALLQSRFIF